MDNAQILKMMNFFVSIADLENGRYWFQLRFEEGYVENIYAKRLGENVSVIKRAIPPPPKPSLSFKSSIGWTFAGFSKLHHSSDPGEILVAMVKGGIDVEHLGMQFAARVAGIGSYLVMKQKELDQIMGEGFSEASHENWIGFGELIADILTTQQSESGKPKQTKRKLSLVKKSRDSEADSSV